MKQVQLLTVFQFKTITAYSITFSIDCTNLTRVEEANQEKNDSNYRKIVGLIVNKIVEYSEKNNLG